MSSFYSATYAGAGAAGDNLYSPLKLFNDAVLDDGKKYPQKHKVDPANVPSQMYLESTFAGNIPSFPLDDPFVQAENYRDILYLGIQNFMRALCRMTVGLEKRRRGSAAGGDGEQHTASPGANANDSDYAPFEDHDLVDILRNPNPADSFIDFACQCALNWFLHGRILIWGKPNAMGAPERMYCLPVPLCQPAFNVGNPQYPKGAWRVQQYYPTTGMVGLLPTGMTGMSGAVIDAREVYEKKNPHPLYRWAPFSPQRGSSAWRDLIYMIDKSFWSIMVQGIRIPGIMDLPGADDTMIEKVQWKIQNVHAGVDNHGKPLVIGGGDPARPAIKWNPITTYNEATPHEEGWFRYASASLQSIFGLRANAAGISQDESYAGLWAAKKFAREEAYDPFMTMLCALLTHGGAVKQWGLLPRGVRVSYKLPEMVGYEPGEMSRDGAGDGSMTYDEVRALRGLPAWPDLEIGRQPVMIAVELLQKKAGIDDESKQKRASERDQQFQQKQMQADQQFAVKQDEAGRKHESDMAKNNPQNQRPNNPGGEGSLGGAGNGPPKPGASVKSITIKAGRLNTGARKKSSAAHRATTIARADSRHAKTNDNQYSHEMAWVGHNRAHTLHMAAAKATRYHSEHTTRHIRLAGYHLKKSRTHLDSLMAHSKCMDSTSSLIPPPKQGKLRRKKKKRRTDTKSLDSLVSRVLSTPVVMNGSTPH